VKIALGKAMQARAMYLNLQTSTLQCEDPLFQAMQNKLAALNDEPHDPLTKPQQTAWDDFINKRGPDWWNHIYDPTF
jgi:hypothetical protein